VVRAWITPLASIFLLVAVVVAVFELFSTNAASQEADQRTQYEALSARLIDLDAVFIDHPELTPYFWKGKWPDGDETQRQTIDAIALQRVDYDAYAYDELVYMETAPEDGSFTASGSHPAGSSEDNSDPWVLWSETIVGQFRNSPAMCKILAEPRYDQRFITALRNTHACRYL
jgi:hypothetical protein